MTQYVYLLKRHRAEHQQEVLEVLGEILEPKSADVLDFLDALAATLGSSTDKQVKLVDGDRSLSMRGRVLGGKRITSAAIRAALLSTTGARETISSVLRDIAEQPELLFEKPRNKGDWETFREMFALRTLIQQARSKDGLVIGICHD